VQRKERSGKGRGKKELKRNILLSLSLIIIFSPTCYYRRHGGLIRGRGSLISSSGERKRKGER